MLKIYISADNRHLYNYYHVLKTKSHPRKMNFANKSSTFTFCPETLMYTRVSRGEGWVKVDDFYA